MNGRKRKVQIKFYVTEEERALIEQKMKLVPTRNMAAYLRKIAIDGYIIQTDHSDIKAMTAEIQKIGVNINQIAKRVNATGSVYQEDIEEIKGVLAEIWVLDISVFNFSFFGKLVFNSSLFNCVGFSDVGLSGVGFSNIGLSAVGFSNTGQSNAGGCGCS